MLLHFQDLEFLVKNEPETDRQLLNSFRKSSRAIYESENQRICRQHPSPDARIGRKILPLRSAARDSGLQPGSAVAEPGLPKR
jgi:hypothetical protein